VEFSKKKEKNSICNELPKNSMFSKKVVQDFRGYPINDAEVVFWSMNERASCCVGQKCNYSSSELGVEREDLLHYCDFQCALLNFFKPMIPTILERMISKVTLHRLTLQRRGKRLVSNR